MYGNPLFFAEKEIQYKKHLERLSKITKNKNLKSQTVSSIDTIQKMHKIRNKSHIFHVKERTSQMNTANQKMLSKIMEISQRKSVPAYSTIAPSKVTKKEKSMMYFNNPERKKRQKEIVSHNTILAKRLLSKQSQFEHSKVMKEIQQYEKVRESMKNNRRIKFIPLAIQDGVYSIGKGNTIQNSQVSEKKKLMRSEGDENTLD